MRPRGGAAVQVICLCLPCPAPRRAFLPLPCLFCGSRGVFFSSSCCRLVRLPVAAASSNLLPTTPHGPQQILTTTHVCPVPFRPVYSSPSPLRLLLSSPLPPSPSPPHGAAADPSPATAARRWGPPPSPTLPHCWPSLSGAARETNEPGATVEGEREEQRRGGRLLPPCSWRSGSPARPLAGGPPGGECGTRAAGDFARSFRNRPPRDASW